MENGDGTRLDPDAGLVGPAITSVSCGLGVECILTIPGYGQAMTNKVRIVASDSPCNGAANPRNPLPRSAI